MGCFLSLEMLICLNTHLKLFLLHLDILPTKVGLHRVAPQGGACPAVGQSVLGTDFKAPQLHVWTKVQTQSVW